MMKIKLVYKDEICIAKGEVGTIQDLENLVRVRFPAAEFGEKMRLHYIDEEGDKVRVSFEEDLQIMLEGKW